MTRRDPKKKMPSILIDYIIIIILFYHRLSILIAIYYKFMTADVSVYHVNIIVIILLLIN